MQDMENYVKIGNYKVGSSQPVFVVAEIGINHNGDLAIAKKLIDMAKEAGCQAVKFQKRTPEKCVPEDQKNKMRETPWGYMTYLDYKKKIEFEKKEYGEIDKYCKDKGILWLASCWDEDSVDFMEQFNPPCYKIASACLTDDVLLKHIRSKNRPIILSTGMSTQEQVDHAVSVLGKDNLVLLHAVSTYPAEIHELNLNAIKTLKQKYPNIPIGYSGHERGVVASVVAAALGACVVERHITLDRAMWGTDQSASLEKKGLQILIKEICNLEKAQGDGIKVILASEEPILKKLRRI